jgi:hypothetical protein
MTQSDAAHLGLIIRAFVVLQDKLMGAFRKSFPGVQDWQLLLDCPKSGKVAVDGEPWTFRKHGSGLVFTNAAHVVVDMHTALPDVAVIDAWRLLQYLESTATGLEMPVTEASLTSKLEELAKSGMLRKLPGMARYVMTRLNHPAKR